MTFPAYPNYKDSEVEWLGVVPEHWCSAPIKYMALERNSLFLDGDWIESKDISSDGIRYITTGNVGEGTYKEQGTGFISEETFHSLGCTDVYEGDVLISRLNNPIGRACITPDLGGRIVTSVDNVIFRPDAKYHKKFIVYLFSSEEYFKHTGNLARGATMQRISRGLLGNIRVVTPSLEEQAQIARYLDHETAGTDALIEEQQRLIELLKEKRQAVISHAVTKGLDPTVPMKDSGVEWLGEVPAHWVVLAIKWRARIKSGDGISPDLIENQAQDDKPHPVIGGNGVMGFTSQTNVSPPLIVIGRVGALCGNVHKIYEPAWVSDNALILDFDRRSFDINYLVHVLDARNLNEISDKSAQPLITGSKVTSQFIPCPSRHEQLEIAKFLEGALSEFDQLVLEGIKGIELLKERRSALISAAVNGKIDVRGWQPPASAQAPELAQEAV